MVSIVRYAIKILAYRLATLFAVLALLVLLVKLTPYTPFDQLLIQGYITREQYRMLLEITGFNKPFHEMYFMILKNFFTLNFGTSIIYGRPVVEVIAQRLPYTIALMATAYLIGSCVGIALGTFSAVRRGTKIDGVIMAFVVIVRSMPVFWLGMILLYILAFQYKLFEFGGVMSVQFPEFRSNVWRYIVDWFWHTILPAITLSKIYAVTYMLTVRNLVITELDKDYVSAVYAKGVEPFRILHYHVMKNVAPPVLTTMAIDVGFLVGGAVITETVFAYPGMGRLIFEAINANDYPLILASFFLISVIVLTTITIAEILYAYIDPRIRISRGW